MARDYCVEVCKELEAKFGGLGLHRPMRIGRYEAGAELNYDVTSVEGANKGSVRLKIEKFVGGGFAGQVYQVRIEEIGIDGDGCIGGLEVGGLYAMKILIPPSGFSLLFRNLLYWIGFQGPFQLQVNPSAARAGAIWQKFIRRGAAVRFGDEGSVVDIHATFVDENLGSCGELSEWVDGRTWRLEVDDRMDLLRRSNSVGGGDAELGSPEYRAKRKFMREFVGLLHDVGAHEFARQYEWSTCKSQPNCLKRKDAGEEAGAGLTAVDFRAGLALLPVLPMSPGDFKLIIMGIMRGSLVQFDRGNIKKLEAFIGEHPEAFADTGGMLEELKEVEEVYRNSTPDVTHNHVRLLGSGKLWSTMFAGAVTGWRVRNYTDADHEVRLRGSKVKTVIFFLVGVVPLLGGFLRRIWGRGDWRKHYSSMVGSYDYFRRAVKGRVVEQAIGWHRKGRISGDTARKFGEQPWRYLLHLPFLLLVFPSFHRLFTDGKFAREKLHYIFVRPFTLYFSSHLREQWLRDMVREGQGKHILTDDDAETILSRINEPYIQRYLVSLVVHLFTLPVTQVVSAIHILIWNLNNPDATDGEKIGISIAIAGIYQIIPISPGSFCRGLYTTGLAIYDRNFKDYNIALFLSYFKYVGYLAFPIQMTYHYPVLARFMAGHWATEAVHVVPVFGERGALLEHWVYCLFYNWPLTIRRRMRLRAEARAKIKARYWHVGVYSAVVAGCILFVDLFHLRHEGALPSNRQIWWLLASLPLIYGSVVTLGCGGAVIWKRIVAAVVGGIAAATVCVVGVGIFGGEAGDIGAMALAKTWIWRSFILAVVSAIGAFVTELRLPEPSGQ